MDDELNLIDLPVIDISDDEWTIHLERYARGKKLWGEHGLPAPNRLSVATRKAMDEFVFKTYPIGHIFEFLGVKVMVIERSWSDLSPATLNGIVIAHPDSNGGLGKTILTNQILLKLNGYKYPYGQKAEK